MLQVPRVVPLGGLDERTTYPHDLLPALVHPPAICGSLYYVVFI